MEAGAVAVTGTAAGGAATAFRALPTLQPNQSMVARITRHHAGALGEAGGSTAAMAANRPQTARASGT